jgi:outer membrane protein assembly factor BamE (lipoprotein component of BamABCDE complex)
MQSTIPTGLLLLLLGFVGCSSFAPDVASDRYMVGKTSREQVSDFFGEPNKIDTVSVAGTNVLMYFYRFTNPQPKPPELYRGVSQVPQKNLVLEFVNDTLHGYIYNSAGQKPSTTFKSEHRGEIVIGQAHQSTVRDLLGEPAGKFVLPTLLFDHPTLKHLGHVVPTNAAEAWCYYYDYFYFRSGKRRRFEYYKLLAVYFDSNGRAIDKFYRESDRTEPRMMKVYGQ